MHHRNTTGMDRRTFLGKASGAGLMLLAPGSALGTRANSTLQVGVTGCGGRGPWIGDIFQRETRSQVTAVHDYFRDQAEAAGDRLGVPADGRFWGFDGYAAMLEKVDAAAIISPPYFHPEQFVAAVDAGKHVYLAKPIAVDVPGCQSIVDAAGRVEGTLSTWVDFQTRNNKYYVEAIRRVHDGAIGEPACGQVFYHAGRLNLKATPGTETARLRNWVFDKALSGDIIVEQNIHVLDVANWVLQSRPLEAWGTGGRRVRTDVGDCWDHFIVTYRYPNDVLIDFSSTQFNYGFDDLCDRIFGANGTLETHYGGDVFIKNRHGGWPGGDTGQIYRDGAVNNVKAFWSSIVEGKPITNVRDSADSTLTAILGRMAAYTERMVTWDAMLSANEKLDARLVLPEDGPMTARV